MEAENILARDIEEGEKNISLTELKYVYELFLLNSNLYKKISPLHSLNNIYQNLDSPEKRDYFTKITYLILSSDDKRSVASAEDFYKKNNYVKK